MNRKVLTLVVIAFFFTLSCGGPSGIQGPGNIVLTMKMQNMKMKMKMKSMSVLSSIKTLATSEVSMNITPSSYKIALVNFWLIKSDGTTVNIINSNEKAPTYTESSPLIVNFTSNAVAQQLFATKAIQPGTYTGYKMQFLYLEMSYPVIFHKPAIGVESDYPMATNLMNKTNYFNFRLYFNAYGKYWKRDFVAELETNSNQWFWMRRSVEDKAGVRNFFISVANNNHPSGNGAPDSTIDLFDNPDFWGQASDYSSSANPVIVGTHSTVGGVSAILEGSFTIPSSLEQNMVLEVTVDVTNTMNFWEYATATNGMSPGYLDLGPGYGADNYGDKGLHPFMPKFSVKVQ